MGNFEKMKKRVIEKSIIKLHIFNKQIKIY